MRTFHNTVLRALPPEIIERLDLRPVEFELNHEIEWPGCSTLCLALQPAD